MPLFYFTDFDTRHNVSDDGVELPDLEAVRRMVADTLPRIAADELKSFTTRRAFMMTVKDEAGQTVHSATLCYTET